MRITKRSTKWLIVAGITAISELLLWVTAHPPAPAMMLGLIPLVAPLLLQYLQATEALNARTQTIDGANSVSERELMVAASRAVCLMADRKVTCKTISRYAGAMALTSIAGVGVLALVHQVATLYMALLLPVSALCLIAFGLSRLLYPGRSAQLRAIEPIQNFNQPSIDALLTAALDFDEPARNVAAHRLATIRDKGAIKTATSMEAYMFRRLADALHRLDGPCCLAALRLMQRSETAFLLPNIEKFVTQIYKRPDSSSLLPGAEQCVAVLRSLSIMDTHRETLLRSGDSTFSDSLVRPGHQPVNEEQLLQPVSTSLHAED